MSGTTSGETELSIMKTTRFGDIVALCNNHSVIAVENTEYFTEMMNDILKLTTKYRNIVAKQDGHVNDSNDIRDLNVIKGKGNPRKPKKHTRKRIRCSNCHLLGHNSRKCTANIVTEDNDVMASAPSTQQNELMDLTKA